MLRLLRLHLHAHHTNRVRTLHRYLRQEQAAHQATRDELAVAQETIVRLRRRVAVGDAVNQDRPGRRVPDETLRAAAEQYERGGIGEVMARSKVSRATAYRWIGDARAIGLLPSEFALTPDEIRRVWTEAGGAQ